MVHVVFVVRWIFNNVSPNTIWVNHRSREKGLSVCVVLMVIWNVNNMSTKAIRVNRERKDEIIERNKQGDERKKLKYSDLCYRSRKKETEIQ